MAYYLTKIVVTAFLVVLISEISKRSSIIGAILASIPLTSVLAMIWLYVDTGSTTQVSALASNILWLVLPSLALFITLPILLKHGVNFYISLAASIGITSVCYFLMLLVLRYLRIEI